MNLVNTIKQTISTAIALAVVVAVSTTSVFADGETKTTCTTGYGDSVVCTTEKTTVTPQVDVQTVNTGIVENMALVGIVATFGLGFLLKARQEAQVRF